MNDISVTEARKMLAGAKADQLLILDVRQEWEYEEMHLPGALWIPLPELPDRLSEVDAEKPVLVYCRSGGRSKAGAMLLDGSGRQDVYSMNGGIMSWEGSIAIGPIDSGMAQMLSIRSVRDALLTAYGMESFLQRFYVQLRDTAHDDDAQAMFDKLAGFEDGHMNSLYERYVRSEEEPLDRAAFDGAVSLVAAEGGVDPAQFLARHGAVMETVVDIVGMAMMFEAQALDFYVRASRKLEGEEMTQIMTGLAREEQAHLKVLASYMDKQA